MKFLKEEDFKAEVIETKGKVLVDFYATWCGPCKMLSPIIEELDFEIGETVKICKVDVDECPKAAADYQIESIPTIMVFENGKPINKRVGYISKREILSLVE